MTVLAEMEEASQSPAVLAIESANGSGTLTTHIHVARPGAEASVSTLLGAGQRPPSWVQRLILEDIPARDEYGLLGLDALVRFARACLALPERTPKPYYGVGDDATIGVEWDLGRYHLELQVGNNSAVDTIVLEVDGGEVSELPLAGNIYVLAWIMAMIISR